MEVVKLQVAITGAGVERGQGAARVTFALVSVMPQIIEWSSIWIVIDAVLKRRKEQVKFLHVKSV